MRRPLEVLVRVDASSRIGGGHVIRCLTLADELARRGHTVTFVCASISDFCARLVQRAGHRLTQIEPVKELQTETDCWDSTILSVEGQREDAARTAAAGGETDWVILDHYRLDGRWLACGEFAKDRRLVLDDLANRSFECDILVDQTLGRGRADYTPFVPPDCTVLAGPQFALLRPEFATARPAALERRRKSRKAERLLVSLGATDIRGVTLTAVQSLLAAGVDCAIDVVLASGASSLEPVRALAIRDARIATHVDSDDMAGLMASADLAIGAPGTSSWERCCLGLPAATLQLADNQALVSRSLTEVGATIAIDDVQETGPAAKRLIANGSERARMVAAAAAIVDGRGVRRVIDAMLGQEEAAKSIHLRLANEQDSETLWLWRNDPVMRAMAKTHQPISWDDHVQWFHRVRADDCTCIYIAEIGAERAAMIRFDRVHEAALVSINVNPALRGGGIGKAVLSVACQQYAALYPGTDFLAEVKTGNAASQRIFEASGFRQQGVSEPDYLRYFRRSER